jgi:hypothetical protein
MTLNRTATAKARFNHEGAKDTKMQKYQIQYQKTYNSTFFFLLREYLRVLCAFVVKSLTCRLRPVVSTPPHCSPEHPGGG